MMLKSSPISLRNYPLHIDQIEDLGLPADEYACAMADGLAFLLWVAEIDACDVEFVLARPRPRPLTPHGGDDDNDNDVASPTAGNTSLDTTFTSNALGTHALWVLDFDCCKKLPMTIEGVNIAAERFWRNDPYYPNPNARCEKVAALWDVFKDRLLETSAEMMVAHKDEAIRALGLPGLLIARIVDTVGVYSKGVVPSASVSVLE